MAKKIIAVIMAAIAAVSLAGCSAQEETGGAENPAVIEKGTVISEDTTTFKLSYTQSDSLNPLEARTLNNQVLSQLVFESLFDVDDNFKADLNIASSYEYTSPNELKVGITAGLTFTDGGTLTADDVVSSFDAAKDSAYWGSSLTAIGSCRAVSQTELVFRLEEPDPYAHNLLVFPIVSSDSGGNYPVGNGRYYYADENGETVLKANPTNSFKPHITVIHLENIASDDSIDNAVNIGNISFAFRDLSSNTSTKMTANKRLVNMNNLVYIGINNKSGITANPEVRKAISLAIDRETLARSAYGGFAQPATGVFNPQFELSQTELFSAQGDPEAAKQLLSAGGVSNASLSVLVNSSNKERLACAKLIEQQLEEAGFSVTLVQEADNAKYLQRVQSESFSLYIGETKIPPDMSLGTFFSEDGAAHYGMDVKNSASAQIWGRYMSSQAQLGSLLLEFADEIPFIPVVYRKGMICFTKTMNGDVQGSYYDCFANIEDWYFEAE